MVNGDGLTDAEAIALLLKEPNKAALKRFGKNFWELSDEEHEILIQEGKERGESYDT